MQHRQETHLGMQGPRYRATRLEESEATVLVEFTGTGSRTVSPPGSGVTYRFGQDDGHRQRRVRKVDAPRILANPLFRLAEGSADDKEPVRASSASPVRAAAPASASANRGRPAMKASAEKDDDGDDDGEKTDGGVQATP